jgi:hypothetical protein
MPVANVVGQANNLLIDGQHPFWNGFQASGTPVGRISSSVQRASNILPLDITGLVEGCAKRGNLGRGINCRAAAEKPITGIAGCCARAASGHATAAPPISAINSRRPIPEARMAAGRRWMRPCPGVAMALPSPHYPRPERLLLAPLRHRNVPLGIPLAAPKRTCAQRLRRNMFSIPAAKRKGIGAVEPRIDQRRTFSLV